MQFKTLLFVLYVWLFLVTAAIMGLYVKDREYYNSLMYNPVINEPVPLSVPIKEPDIIEEEITESYFYTTSPIEITKEDLECLTRNVYFEAGIESYDGKIAVAQITLNRLESGRWGENICSVVYARAQFSWTLWKKNRTKKPYGPLWEDSKRVVYDFINGTRIHMLDNSLHYHSDYIRTPFWASEERKIIQIGKHIFYEG